VVWGLLCNLSKGLQSICYATGLVAYFLLLHTTIVVCPVSDVSRHDFCKKALSNFNVTWGVLVDTVCSKCFFWLRQLKRVRRSLDAESMKTLVHAFVTSRVDYGNIILVGAPKSVTNKLQRVLNAAARIVTGTRKYDQGLSHLLHTELHWLDVPERVLYKLALMVHRCFQDKAPQYYYYLL